MVTGLLSRTESGLESYFEYGGIASRFANSQWDDAGSPSRGDGLFVLLIQRVHNLKNVGVQTKKRKKIETFLIIDSIERRV